VGNFEYSFDGLMTNPFKANCFAFILTLNTCEGSVSLYTLKTALLHSLALSLLSFLKVLSFFCDLDNFLLEFASL